MKNHILFAIFCLGAFDDSVAQNNVDSSTAFLQFIHNTADPALTEIDIYIDGRLVVDGLSYRHATQFLAVPGDNELRIDIAPDSSTSASASILTTSVNLVSGSSGIALAQGHVSTSGFQNSMAFGLTYFDQARQIANIDTTTDVLILNSSTDIRDINIVVPPAPGGNINEDIFYQPTASGYYELVTGHYQVQTLSIDNTLRSAYRLPLSSLRLHGRAVTIIPSGFLYPALNSNGPELGLFLTMATGGPLLPLDMISNNIFSFAEANILMHPNPVTDFINFEFPFATRIINAQIIDISGQEVRSYQNIDHRLDISDLENGVYTINLTIDDKNFTDKFVKSL